jgi:uncharacterized membrane protein YcaP (DUF421 family)
MLGSDATIVKDEESFDRRLMRVRRLAWAALVPVLVVGALLWQSPGAALSSPVLRTASVYVLVLLVLRLAGKRTLAEMTTFDLVILLLLSEAVQPALTGGDESVTGAALIVLTLVGLDALLGVVKHRVPRVARILDDVPTLLLADGTLREDALRRHRVDADDILEAARLQHGIPSLREVRFAVLERTGGISIVPWER